MGEPYPPGGPAPLPPAGPQPSWPGQPGYAPPVPYGGYVPAPQAPPNAGANFGIAAFCCSMVGWVFGITAILAIIFAAVSFRKSRDAGQPKNGLAVAGLVISIVGLAIGLIWIIALIAAASSVPAGA